MTKVEKNETNLGKCRCPNCPSYNECARGKAERLYCAGEIGKSDCSFKMNGCICGSCPVYRECNLKAGYYCARGSADVIDK